MIELILSGKHHAIYYIARGGHTTFRKFADELRARGPVAGKVRGKKYDHKRPTPKSWKGLMGVLEKAAQHGYKILSNTNMVKTWAADDGTQVAEFRKRDLRVLFFEDETIKQRPTRLIVTNCFKKKSDETPPQEIDRFLRLRTQYYKRRAET